MSAPYAMNPFAPVGLAVPPAAGFLELPTIYVFERTLSALQVVTGAVLSIQTDSDFFLRGIVLAKATGQFQFRYADESVYYTSNTLINSTVLPPTAANPFPVTPQLRYSAGGRVTIDLTDLSGAPNAIQMLFIGTRRFLSLR